MFDVRKSVHHHTIQINQFNKMQQFHKFITWRLCVVQHCFGSLSAHHQEHTNALATSGFTVRDWR